MYGYGNYTPYQYGQQQMFQQYQQPVQQYQQPVQQQKDERVWVQGEVGAKAYMVVPGTTVPLWDSESPTIWLKSVTAAGVPNMVRIPYTIEGVQQTAAPADDYEKRFVSIEERLKALETPRRRKDKEEKDDV